MGISNMLWKAIGLAFIAGAAVATAVITWYKDRNKDQHHVRRDGANYQAIEQTRHPAPSGDEARTCTICHEFARDTVIQPCGHICSCQVCALQLNDCPICRARIQSLQRVYLA